MNMDKITNNNANQYMFNNLLRLCTHEKLNKDLIAEDVKELCNWLHIGKLNLELTDIEIEEKLLYSYELYNIKEECGKEFTYSYPVGQYRQGKVIISLLKGYDKDENLDTFANIITLITNNVNCAKMINRAKYYDAQTGVANLKFVKEKMNRLLDEGNKISDYAIIYANIQNFKYINDSWGVAAGDAAIIKYTHTLVGLAKEDEAIGRLGGDHFIICVKRDSLDNILEALGGIVITGLPGTGGRKFELAAWAGIMVNDDDNMTFDVRMQAAIDAYSMAKNRLKKRVVYYNSGFKDTMDWTRKVRGLFSKSIEELNIYPVLQAKVNMKTGKLVGFEALCRWQYEGKIIPSVKYIPILDSNGMIHELDMYMLRVVCSLIREWLDCNIKIPVISVNISRKNLFIDNIEDKIYNITKEVGVDPKYIDIEITESSTEDEFSKLQVFISKMHKLGFAISIDDFGVGYSSLSLLHKIDADVIKFDKSFIDNICSSNKVEYIVESILNYANKVGVRTIAEGVENIDQGKKLLSMGCEVCQGFYYGKPLTIQEATDKLINPDYVSIA